MTVSNASESPFARISSSTRARDASGGISSEYYEIRTGYGPLHVHIDYDEQGPYRIFVNLPPVGTENGKAKNPREIRKIRRADVENRRVTELGVGRRAECRTLPLAQGVSFA